MSNYRGGRREVLKMKMKQILMMLAAGLLLLCSCGSKKTSDTTTTTPVGPDFQADSAYWFCQQQCEFGPRTMNSEAHELCGQWIVQQFRQYGMQVMEQRATLRGYDGTPLKSTNIIASYRPEVKDRILLCAHWDSRPWADNDPDPSNWKTPVMAANDGASGVAVMLEIARLLSLSPNLEGLALGVDFICFDAEDWGVPQWSDQDSEGDSWALGAQYWAAHPHVEGYKARYGILLDMVGGQGAHFYREQYSMHYAPHVVRRVWQAAEVAGYSGFFVNKNGGAITDDHVPVNQVAGIPCIDIIPYYPDCEASSFGLTWHTVNDDMQHIDRNTLEAVGQTLVQVLFESK